MMGGRTRNDVEVVLQQEQLKGHLEGLILAVLAAGPLHGYGIMEQLRARSSGVVDLEGGTVYPALHRLEASGQVAGKWSKGPGRRRRTYQLTRKGRAALAAQRTSWEQFVAALGGIMSPPVGTVAP